MDASKLKNILEAGLLVAGRTLSIAQLEGLFEHDEEKPERKIIKEALESLKEEYTGRGIELVEVASGYRLQSHESVADWVANLFQEKTPRYSRALLETLVLIAYRQPITRAEIEEVRGVAVSSNIIKTLQERQWVKVLGHKEVPGRPALLGTTKDFLDYFNLKKLDELPSLADIKDLDQFDELLAEEIGEVDEQGDAANDGGDSVDGDDAGDSRTENSDESGGGVSAAGDVAGADGSEVDDSESNDSESDVSESDVSEGDTPEDGASELSASAVGLDNEGEAGDIVSEGDDAADIDLGSADSNNIDEDNLVADDDGADGDDESAEPILGSQAAYGAMDVDGAAGSQPEAENATADSSDSDNDNDEEGAPEHNETLSGPELELLRVISDFSDEHQQEVEARDELEASIVSNKADENDDVDVSDLSQRLGDDRNSGDMPEPGDTLH